MIKSQYGPWLAVTSATRGCGWNTPAAQSIATTTATATSASTTQTPVRGRAGWAVVWDGDVVAVVMGGLAGECALTTTTPNVRGMAGNWESPAAERQSRPQMPPCFARLTVASIVASTSAGRLIVRH